MLTTRFTSEVKIDMRGWGLPSFESFTYKTEKVKRLIENTNKKTILFGTEFDCTIWTVFMCEFEIICMQYDA